MFCFWKTGKAKKKEKKTQHKKTLPIFVMFTDRCFDFRPQNEVVEVFENGSVEKSHSHLFLKGTAEPCCH